MISRSCDDPLQLLQQHDLLPILGSIRRKIEQIERYEAFTGPLRRSFSDPSNAGKQKNRRIGHIQAMPGTCRPLKFAVAPVLWTSPRPLPVSARYLPASARPGAN